MRKNFTRSGQQLSAQLLAFAVIHYPQMNCLIRSLLTRPEKGLSTRRRAPFVSESCTATFLLIAAPFSGRLTSAGWLLTRPGSWEFRRVYEQSSIVLTLFDVVGWTVVVTALLCLTKAMKNKAIQWQGNMKEGSWKSSAKGEKERERHWTARPHG